MSTSLSCHTDTLKFDRATSDFDVERAIRDHEATRTEVPFTPRMVLLTIAQVTLRPLKATF